MNDLVCLERVGAWLRAKLAEPGFLRGRQRGEEYVERLIQFGLYVARAHGRDDHEHIFPLSRMPMSGLASLGLPEWSIRSFVGVLTRAGFIEPQGALIRRCHAGTVSPTEGAKAVWWSPRQFKLSQAIRSLFGKSLSPTLDAPPIVNQSPQDETLYLSEEEPREGLGFYNKGSEVLGGSDPDDDDIDEELEEALDGYRRTVVPAAMPDRRRAQRWEPTEVAQEHHRSARSMETNTRLPDALRLAAQEQAKAIHEAIIAPMEADFGGKADPAVSRARSFKQVEAAPAPDFMISEAGQAMLVADAPAVVQAVAKASSEGAARRTIEAFIGKFGPRDRDFVRQALRRAPEVQRAVQVTKLKASAKTSKVLKRARKPKSKVK